MNNPVIPILIKALGKEKVLLGEALEERYEHIWHTDKALNAIAVLLPRSTEEVARILKTCHQFDQPIVMHGGLTGLVGGTRTTASELVLSLEKMNQILDLDESSRTITVEAGVILENIQNASQEKGFLFPLNFGAKGSAQIGGIISTNAGGLRVFRYGMTRELVLGLEVVLADGTILSNLKKIIKDNSGYDLKQLFIGAEGTLGVITKAVLKLKEAPQSRISALIGLHEYAKVVQLLRFMDAGLAGTLSAFELIWNNTLKGLTAPDALVKSPLPYDYKYYVLLESLGSDQEKDEEKIKELLEKALEMDLIQDAAIASTAADLKWFWTIREEVHVIISKLKYEQSFDISIPIPAIGEEIERMVKELEQVEGLTNIYPFGHIADGNIHFIIGKENDSLELKEKIESIIYSSIARLNGSVSAEHGIGLDKKAYLSYSKSSAEIAIMKVLKHTFDPKHILNPGKLLEL